MKNRRRLKPAPYSRAVQAREEVAHASWSCVKAATPRPRATLSVVTRRRHDRDASVRSGLGDFSRGEQPWHAPVYEATRLDSIRGKRLRRTKTRLTNNGCCKPSTSINLACSSRAWPSRPWPARALTGHPYLRCSLRTARSFRWSLTEPRPSSCFVMSNSVEAVRLPRLRLVVLPQHLSLSLTWT